MPTTKLLYLLLLLLGISTAANAQKITKAPATELQLSVGEWPPFLSNSLPHKGVVAHLIHDVFAQAGINVTFTFLPWARAYRDAANGKYAATAIWMKNPQRANIYFYSDPVLNEQFVFFHKKNQPFEWRTFKDLNNLILGGGLAYSYGAEFDKELEKGNLELSRVSTTEQNFRRLALGRIDAFAEDINVGYHVLNNQLPELATQITHHEKLLSTNQSFLLFPKNAVNSEKLLKIFNQHLAQFKQNGRYQTYFDRLNHGAYQPVIE